MAARHGRAWRFLFAYGQRGTRPARPGLPDRRVLFAPSITRTRPGKHPPRTAAYFYTLGAATPHARASPAERPDHTL